MRYVLLLVGLLLIAAGAAVCTGAFVWPARYDPWAPLDVAAAPNLLTGFKLARARRDPAACRAALATTGMAYDAVPDRPTGTGCGFEGAVRLRGAGVRLAPAPVLSCPMALSFHLWERHALQPAARRHLGEPVAAVEHLGSYACRNIFRGEGALPDAPRSRHATADALDVSGVILKSGRRIALSKDWRPADDVASTPSAALLQDAHRGACTWFDGVLGPDYNAAHRDHFHLETGGYSMCR